MTINKRQLLSASLFLFLKLAFSLSVQLQQVYTCSHTENGENGKMTKRKNVTSLKWKRNRMVNGVFSMDLHILYMIYMRVYMYVHVHVYDIHVHVLVSYVLP